jgi:hypothetical protein
MALTINVPEATCIACKTKAAVEVTKLRGGQMPIEWDPPMHWTRLTSERREKGYICGKCSGSYSWEQ